VKLVSRDTDKDARLGFPVSRVQWVKGQVPAPLIFGG